MATTNTTRMGGDRLENLSGVKPAVGVNAPAPAAPATLPMTNEASDTKVCNAPKLVSNAFRDHAYIPAEVVGSTIERQTDPNAEKEENEKEEQAREEDEDVVVRNRLMAAEDKELEEEDKEETKFANTNESIDKNL